MINTSVSRAHLEPSTAVAIHHPLGLPTSLPELRPGQRLPRLRQRHAAGRDHDRLAARSTTRCVVNGEGARYTQERHASTGSRRPDATAAGRARAVRHPDPRLGRGGDGARPRRPAPGGPPLRRRASSRAGTEHHDLCVGRPGPHADRHQAACSRPAWRCRSRPWADAKAEFDWAGMDCYIAHQISQVHTSAMCEAARHRLRDAVPLTLPDSRQHGPGRGAVHPGRQQDRALRPATGCCCWASARA